jgi:hypothetical protein
MAEYEYKDETFHCDNLGSDAIITRKFLIHRSARSADDKIDKKHMTEIECDSVSEDCGVRIRKGNMFENDWSKCAHHELRKLGS